MFPVFWTCSGFPPHPFPPIWPWQEWWVWFVLPQPEPSCAPQNTSLVSHSTELERECSPAAPALTSMGFVSWWEGPREKLWQAPGAVHNLWRCWRPPALGEAQGGLIPRWAERRSHPNDPARNQKFVCLLSSIHCTVCIQIPIQISLKLKYWIIQCKQLCETQTSWLITLWLPLTHRNNLTPWVRVPNHTWNWVSYTTS